MSSIRAKFTDGLRDFAEPHDIPHNALSDMLGFSCRRGFAETVKGRSDLTNASELRTSKRVRKVGIWNREDGTEVIWAVIDGGLWQLKETAGVLSIDTTKGKSGLLSYIVTDGTASRAATTVTFTNAHDLTLCVREGDYFFFDADGPSAGGLVDSGGVAAGALTLAAYAGSETSGAYTIWRKLNDGRVSVVYAGDRLWIADGVGPLHWYGDDGAGTDIFRPAGMAKPATSPSLTAGAAGGNLEGGDYLWKIAFKDARGNVSPAQPLWYASVTEDDKMTFASLPEGYPWTSEYVLYRSIVDTEVCYRVVKDIDTKAASIAAYVGGSDHTVITLDTDYPTLVADQHIHRKLTFADSGNTYIIKDNAAGTITVHGDADGETGTAFLLIHGDFNYDKAKAGSIIDSADDNDLDTDTTAPATITNTTRSYNEPPPAGLQYLAVFEGDGRMAAYKEGTGTQVWFSGRPPLAPKTGQPEFFGAGEFDYWPHYHNAGPRDGHEVQGLAEISNRLIAVRDDSIWDLVSDDADVAAWNFFPVQGAEKVGTKSPDSIVVQHGAMWFLGKVAGKLDIVRFDGAYANGVGYGRGAIKDVFDTINTAALDEITGAVFDNFYYVSYPHSSNTVNTRTLRFDIMRGLNDPTFDVQGWGLGVMFVRDDQTLICGAPTTEGYIYKAHGTSQDLGSDMARHITTADILPDDIEDESQFPHVIIEMVIF